MRRFSTYESCAILSLLVYICMQNCAFAQPVHNISTQLIEANGNLTTLNAHIAPGYVPQPSYRGTFDIVWSCLLTSFACLYNVIHLEISPPKSRARQWSYRSTLRLALATLTLIFPEFLAVIASAQFLNARNAKNEVNKARSQYRGKDRYARRLQMHYMRD